MPASFLKRHRTICEVLEEIRGMATFDNTNGLEELVDEAKDYAEAMSNKLAWYKEQQNERE